MANISIYYRNMNKKTGIIVGAAPIGSEAALLVNELNKDENHYTVAADGGIEFFYNQDICPDMWLGDMDSAQESLDINKVMVKWPSVMNKPCSPIKDYTDMELAIEDALSNNCTHIKLFGCLGGERLSHTLANIQLMAKYYKKGIRIEMFGENIHVFLIADGDKVDYEEGLRGMVSVLALDTTVENVDIKGLYYEYSGDLTNDWALGVSNELTGNAASISVRKGIVIIIEEFVHNKQCDK